ncbi:hypothetical protein [Paenibacillus hexagrammi]|uniref:hypothetical protein n=1 Tax=Paenibacillus hexagrammi TaxID=2908839 RepID=UPI0028830EBC|nr:hypothetical protein [Paenibacillus sp. YPD9-1]
MLMHLGVVRVGDDENLGTVVQVTKLGSSLIQGTFVAEHDKVELILDPNGSIRASL